MRAHPPYALNAQRQKRAIWRDYLSLTKPRVVALLLLTTLCAMLIAAPGIPAPMTIVWTLIGGYLAAAGAGAINCYCDRDIDSVMTRTRRRPLPSQRIAPRHALGFGLVLTALAVLILWLGVNGLAAALALAGHLWYVVVYTLWLKRHTPRNIVIGGAAGAFPPLVGWAAATGRLAPLAWVLFAIIFAWTPPHFWALALIRRADYARAGVPMLPVVTGDRATHRQVLVYSVALVLISLVPVGFGWLGTLYGAAALGLGSLLIAAALRLLRRPAVPATWRLYTYSLLYLALLFTAMAIDRMVAAWTLGHV